MSYIPLFTVVVFVVMGICQAAFHYLETRVTSLQLPINLFDIWVYALTAYLATLGFGRFVLGPDHRWIKRNMLDHGLVAAVLNDPRDDEQLINEVKPDNPLRTVTSSEIREGPFNGRLHLILKAYERLCSKHDLAPYGRQTGFFEIMPYIWFVILCLGILALLAVYFDNPLTNHLDFNYLRSLDLWSVIAGCFIVPLIICLFSISFRNSLRTYEVRAALVNVLLERYLNVEE